MIDWSKLHVDGEVMSDNGQTYFTVNSDEAVCIVVYDDDAHPVARSYFNTNEQEQWEVITRMELLQGFQVALRVIPKTKVGQPFDNRERTIN